MSIGYYRIPEVVAHRSTEESFLSCSCCGEGLASNRTWFGSGCEVLQYPSQKYESHEEILFPAPGQSYDCQQDLAFEAYPSDM